MEHLRQVSILYGCALVNMESGSRQRVAELCKRVAAKHNRFSHQNKYIAVHLQYVQQRLETCNIAVQWVVTDAN
jgi:hypothetical protein